MVDATHSKCVVLGRVGSTPISGTKKEAVDLSTVSFFFNSVSSSNPELPD